MIKIKKGISKYKKEIIKKFIYYDTLIKLKKNK